MKRIKREIGGIIFKYLISKGTPIKEVYNKTKRFYGIPKSYWKYEGGEWRYYGEDGNIY